MVENNMKIILIDFVKIRLPQKYVSILLNNELLLEKFDTPVNEPTGAIRKNSKVAEWNGIKIQIKDDRHIEISGSLHKYWQNGRNYQDYTYTDLVNTVIDLFTKVNINPYEATLHNVEFGVNVETLFNPDYLIKNILSYKGSSFNEMQRRQGASLGVDCYKQRYAVKAYNKGKQYGLEENNFRFENKVFKMVHVKEAGIDTLADLLDRTKLARLGEMLISSFEAIIIYDKSIDSTKLNKQTQELYKEAWNPKYWEELKRENPKGFDYYRARFRSIVKAHSTNNLQEQALRLITAKWKELLNTADEKTLANLTAFLKQFHEGGISQINTSYSVLIPPNSSVVRADT